MSTRIEVVYNTSNDFKRREAEVLFDTFSVLNAPIRDRFSLRFTTARVKETLEVDLVKMVEQEAIRAYGQLKIPCIVEHAGLVFEGLEDMGYPGGLTKPMWNALGPAFLTETNASDRPAIARAVVGYCDGQDVATFVGETKGRLVEPRPGKHDFYWDTIFVPTEQNDAQKTYAEIVAEQGLKAKLEISQSRKAITKFLQFRAANPPRLWEITY